MSRPSFPLVALAAVAIGCGGGEERGTEEVVPVERAPAPSEAVEAAPEAGETAGSDTAGAETTTGGEPTAAATPAATAAPSPPGGYAVDSRPVEGGRLARIEYASPKSVDEVASFYDVQLSATRRVEIDVEDGLLVAYGLAASTTLGPETTARDVERLLEQRGEPIVVVSSWRLRSDDPPIRDLRSAGLQDQADRLLETKSKVTVVYAVR